MRRRGEKSIKGVSAKGEDSMAHPALRFLSRRFYIYTFFSSVVSSTWTRFLKGLLSTKSLGVIYQNTIIFMMTHSTITVRDAFSPAACNVTFQQNSLTKRLLWRFVIKYNHSYPCRRAMVFITVNSPSVYVKYFLEYPMEGISTVLDDLRKAYYL